MSSPRSVAERRAAATGPATFRSANSRSTSPGAVVADVTPVDGFAEEYLKGLQSLAAELETAITAIAANDLAELEETVRRQEVLCVTLAGLSGLRGAVRRLPLEPSAEHRSAKKKTASLTDEITATVFALDHLSRCYKALLQHSGRSFQLLNKLCGTYTGQTYNALHPQRHAGRPQAGGSNYKNWDCEI
ncbi:MAG TPA: hypothetical protein VGD64_01350 [Acidisarcina sp.]